MSDATAFETMVERILSGDAPLPLRSAAARGALPVPRAVLVQLYLHLRNDATEEVRQDAETSLKGLGKESIGEVLSDPACPAPVLSHFAELAARDAALAEKVAFHPAAPDDALSKLAETGSAAVLDLVLTNQERLLACPGLLDRLSSNPALRADQRGKVIDILGRFFDSAGRKVGDEAAEEGEGAALEETAALLDVDVGELLAASEIEGGEEFESCDDHIVRTAYKKILTLNVAQKALLAMKGGREERFILIRDTNKIVSLSVLKNGRITDGEIESMAAMRNVSDEVLRTIGKNREWVKNYTTILNLVKNPRTPPGISTNFVSRLQNRDLKFLSRDRNVPEIMRRMAKRLHDQRTTPATNPFQKKH